SHTLEEFINDVSRDIEDPETRLTVWKRNQLNDVANARSPEVRDEARHRASLRIGALGSGSDYTPFLQHAGIASLNLGYGGEDGGGIYHSIYDDFKWFAAVHERRVVERREPFEVVVDRVIDAAAVLAAVAQAERGDTGVLQERRVIRARAQRPDAEIGAAARLLPDLEAAGVRDVVELVPLPDGEPGLRVLDVPGHVVDEFLERVGARHAEVAPPVGVAVEIGDGLVRQLVGVRFSPFRRAEQGRFFAVPGGVHDRAARLPPLLQQRAVGAGLFEQRHLTGDRVLRAVHPGVVVVAADDPLIRGSRARDARDHVVQPLQAPVGLDPQVHFGRPGSDVVRDAEPAAPLLGGHRTGERGEQRLGVAVRDRQDRNLG